MTLQQFIDKMLAQGGVDFDGAYSKQCVDLFREYHKTVIGASKQPRGVVGAKDFWTNYESDPILQQYYIKIPNTPDLVFQPGDVVVWKSGEFGHIAMRTNKPADLKNFQTIDQNYTGKNEIALVTHTYGYVYGVLRPKVSSTTGDMTKELQACLAQHKDLITQLETEKKKVIVAQSELGEERIKHQETKTELNLVVKELEDAEDEHTKDLERIAVILDVEAEMSQIIPAIETCITYEDKANKADRALAEERARNEAQLKKVNQEVVEIKSDFKRTVEDYEKRLQAALAEIERLKEQKPESGSTTPTRSIWDLIVEFFTRKQV